MPPVAKPKRVRRPSFLRQWRKHRDYTLNHVGERVRMNGTNLGRIEKGEVPYSQDLLEQLADIYDCEIADLLMRDPSDPEGMWSIWQRAKTAERQRIVAVAKALVEEEDAPTPTPHAPQSQGQSQRTSARRRTG